MKSKKVIKDKKIKYKLNQLIVFKDNKDLQLKIGIENEEKTKIIDVLSSNLEAYEKKDLSYIKDLSHFIGHLDEALNLVAPNKYTHDYNHEYTLKQLPKVLKKLKKVEKFNKKINKINEAELGL